MWRHTVLVFAASALALGAQAAWAGAIQGSVTLQGPPPAPKKLPVTIDQYVCGDVKDAEDLIVSAKNGVRYVVAWLVSPPAESASPGERGAAPRVAAGAPPAEMDQKACMFAPRVVVIPAGGTVNFLNSDRLLHNLHGRPKANGSFNRTQPKGRPIPLTFERPEIFAVDCDLHSWMKAWVVVAEHPFYAVSDAEGRFRFDGLPPGRHAVRLWHETLGTATREVVVPATGAVDLAVEMARPAGR